MKGKSMATARLTVSCIHGKTNLDWWHQARTLYVWLALFNISEGEAQKGQGSGGHRDERHAPNEMRILNLLFMYLYNGTILQAVWAG